MSNRRQFTVYLSSTFIDLKDERTAAIDIIRRYAVVLDSCRAGEEGVALTCAGDVKRCDLYVGIVAKRYGYHPPAVENPRDLSITEIEYDACRTDGGTQIGRLMFLKTRFDDEFSDNPSDRIDAFRTRASREQTAFPFKELAEFRLALERAVRAASDEFHEETRRRLGIMVGSAPRHDLMLPAAIGTLVSTDDAMQRAIAGTGDARFHCFEISAADSNWVATFDAGARSAQVSCLLVTPPGLTLLLQPDVASRVLATIQIGAAANRPLVLILAGVEPAALPEAWSAALPYPIGADAIVRDASSSLDALYKWLRARRDGATAGTSVCLPYVIVASTRAEADALLDPDERGFDEYDDVDDRADRIADLKLMSTAARRASKDWPIGHYGDKREDWQCFGAAQPSIERLLLASIERINREPDGSRERRLLRDSRVVPRAYRLEELLDDRHGSGNALIAAIERGGLLMIDELALLHPRLRAATRRLLRSGRTAVVSISACDPAHSPTRRLIGSRSFMHVGALVSRFADELDPRCELSVNSVERLQRWWRLAIPDLVSVGEGAEASAQLVDRVDRLFG